MRRSQGVLPDAHAPAGSGWSRTDRIVISAVVLLIALASLVGYQLMRSGTQLLLPTPPLIAYWHPQVGWGTPLAVGCVLVGIAVQRRAGRLPWRRLLLAGWSLNLAWLMSLTLIDGLDRGWVQVLQNPNEYLHDLPRISDPASFLASFTRMIAFGPGVGGDEVWTTHVAGHPPLITLIFWALDRIGLGGGFWAGGLCILLGSLASLALPITVAELGAPDAARRIVPFVALFPGAVWMAVSADGLFAGVACAGLAAACRGAMRRQLGWSVAGGLVLGTAVFLSYGLVLFGVVVITVLVITVQRRGVGAVVLPWVITVLGALVVGGAHLALGFNWFTGLAELRVRYYQGIGATRPYGYFVWANFAAWAVCCSPLVAVGLVRAVAVLRRAGRRLDWSQDEVLALLACSGFLAALLADLSALSKAETERIWLSFGVVAITGLGLLRGRAASLALVISASWAIVLNHLLETGW